MLSRKIHKIVEIFQKDGRIPHDQVHQLRSRLSSVSDEAFRNLFLSQIVGSSEKSEFEAYFSLGYGELRTTFNPYKYILLHPNSKFAFIQIPKNGCTTIKYSMMDSIRPDLVEEISDCLGNIHKIAKQELQIGTCALPKDIITLVITRDPVSRFWSAFLDKLIRNSKTNSPMVNGFIKHMSKASIISSKSSFEDVKIGDIVEFIHGAGDHLLDRHFASQSAFIPSILPTFNIKIENLNHFASFITYLIGKSPNLNSSPHANSYNLNFDTTITEDWEVSKLRDIVMNKKTIPPCNSLAESIKAKLNIRFEDDLKLYKNSL